MAQDSRAANTEVSDRRRFLASGAVATGAMAGGLALGYGLFFRSAGQYLYPADEGTAWMFVSNVGGIAPGQAYSFQSPTGVPVVITRKAASAADDTATAADFLALSSVCPHLGCRVHWEPQNERFFCPCHLGSFNAEGEPTGGPPLADNQALPQYPLMVENGLLYINMPVKPLSDSADRSIAATIDPASQSPASAGPDAQRGASA